MQLFQHTTADNILQKDKDCSINEKAFGPPYFVVAGATTLSSHGFDGSGRFSKHRDLKNYII
jgi:hypothetical protein